MALSVRGRLRRLDIRAIWNVSVARSFVGQSDYSFNKMGKGDYMSKQNFAAFAAACALAGAVVSIASPAMALAPLECQGFVNFAMQISGKYAGYSCPRTLLMHLDRNRHFNWCLRKNVGQVEADKRAKTAALKKCTG